VNGLPLSTLTSYGFSFLLKFVNKRLETGSDANGFFEVISRGEIPQKISISGTTVNPPSSEIKDVPDKRSADGVINQFLTSRVDKTLKRELDWETFAAVSGGLQGKASAEIRDSVESIVKESPIADRIIRRRSTMATLRRPFRKEEQLIEWITKCHWRFFPRRFHPAVQLGLLCRSLPVRDRESQRNHTKSRHRGGVGLFSSCRSMKSRGASGQPKEIAQQFSAR
jgi:hypothetical protein